VHWTGTRSDDLVTIDGGYEMTLLPGGMYMGCPSNVSKEGSRVQVIPLEVHLRGDKDWLELTM